MVLQVAEPRPAPRSSVRDIAAEAGVSIATVSRVLNGQDNVTAYTRDLVHGAVARLDQAAAGRGRRVTRTGDAVFVRCPYVLTDYFGLIVSSIAETLDLHGRTLILDAGESSQTTQVLADLHRRPGIGGAIMILPPEEREEIVAFRAHDFPFVVVDPRTPLPGDIVAISAAHFTGARMLTSHLTELGHRRIGVIGGPREWMASDARLAGHAAALVDVGVLAPPELVRSVHPTTEEGYQAAGELLDLPERPTAIVGFNDKIAVGALRAAAERGLRVPEDVSVTGFDDIELSRATHPLLTTVTQPLEEMGRMAVTLLVRLQERHKLDALHIDLATELVVRDSTGPVPS